MKLWDSQLWIFFTKPLSWIFRAIVVIRNVLYRKNILRSNSLPVKVISVGNITVGGTGKTPLVCSIARMLQKEGHSVGILSRGYTRRDRSIRIVSDGKSIKANYKDTGDEPVFLAQKLPGVSVTVGKDRYQAGMHTLAYLKRDVFLLDDGFQHRRLKRDFEILTMDTLNPWGNGNLLPSGPLRESIQSIKRATAIVLTRMPKDQDITPVIKRIQKFTSASVYPSYHKPIHWFCLKDAKIHHLEFLEGKRVIAFAGIANPDDFRASLESLNVIVEVFIPFRDHHWYSETDLRLLQKKSNDLGADAIVTTEKDAVKLEKQWLDSLPLYSLSIELNFGDDVRFQQHLLSVFHS